MVQLTNLSVGELVAGAGGDPWAVNQTLQAGEPAQIANLAKAFHAAGRSTSEADHAFEQARKRFDAAWNHQNGDHPINGSAEVQRTAQALGAQSEQLPKIGADLENIAAALAEAQKTGAADIATLDGRLRGLDRIIGAGYSDQLYDAATLRGLVDVGTHNAYQANEQNGYHQQLSEYDSKKLAYEDGVQAASTAGGWVPGVGKVAGPTIGILGHSLENDILGPAPTAPGQTAIQPMDIGSADQEMLDALLGANQPVSALPPEYVVHDHDHPYGRIATLDELQSKYPGLTAGQYNSVIGPALSQALALPPNEKMSPDQYMVDRYNEVIGVPEPPGHR
ncbi:hypothetical protein A5695_26090 [Mycobacterium sp. E1747]|nr:hypothetical protein A5695_26090 [Mycobacterium sp. E1747]